MFSVIASSASGILSAAAFAAAILLVDSFDILLPRGDSVGVCGALVVSGMLVIGLPIGAGVALLSTLTVALVRAKRTGAQDSVTRLGSTLSTRAIALLVSGLVLSVPHSGQVVRAALGTTSFVATELLVAQVAMAVSSGRPLGRLVRGNLSRQMPLMAAQVSVSVLTMITVNDMREWSLIPVVALLMLMRQSYAMLLDVRETYRTTVEVLVEAAEGSDVRRVGHSERTAAIARDIAARIGLSAAQVERISYAALLHDVDSISEHSVDTSLGHSAQVFANADYFKDLLPILALCDGSSLAAMHEDADLLAAMTVALASDIDCMYNRGAAASHTGRALTRVEGVVPQSTKAAVAGAALQLGYAIPAVR